MKSQIKPLYYGIKSVYFIYHGEWSDAEVSYCGKMVNVYIVEEHFYSIFREENPFASEADFIDWMKTRGSDVKEFIREIC